MGAFGASVGTTGTSTLEPPKPEGHSILGFLGNVIGGVKDATLGLGKLVMAPAADIARGALEAASFGKIDIPGGYMTDDVIKGLAAMPKDYWDRYSPLLPGGRPASQIMEELYQKPVSFGLDALAAASLAGKAASLAGTSKAASAGIELADAANVSKELGISMKTAKQVAVRGALESLPEAPWYTKLLPEEKLIRSGAVSEDLMKTSTLRNPLLRALRSPIENRFLTESLDEAAATAARRAEGFGLPMESVKVGEFLKREREFLSKVPEGTRVEKPFVQGLRDTTTATALRNFQSSAWFRDRFKDSHSILKNWKPRVEAMTPTERAASNVLSMKANVVVKGFGDSYPTNTLDEVGAVSNVADTPLMARVQSEAPGYRQEIDLNRPAATNDLAITPNPDGTVTLSGWHAPRGEAGVPAAGTDLGFGGFHFGTREAADARFTENARYGATEPIPVQTTGRFLGTDAPLSEADNTILAAGNFEEAATSGLLDGFMESPDPKDPSTWKDYGDVTPQDVQGLTPAMAQLIDEVGPRGDLKAALQAKGYDGIIYTNEVEHPGSLSAMTFDTAKVQPGVPSAPIPLDLNSADTFNDFELIDALESGDYLYHVTPKENLDAIGREGLTPHAAPDAVKTNGVFVATNWSDADRLSPHQVGKTVLRIDPEKVPASVLEAADVGDYQGEGILYGGVPADAIEVLGADKQWHPISGDVAKPLRTTLDPALLAKAQEFEPGFDPTLALEFLDEYDNQIIADGVGPGWDVQKLKEESAATRDLLLEETEQLATGKMTKQYGGDAIDHANDIVQRADAIRRFEDSPLEMNERAMRAMMIANGMWDESMNALPDVSLAEARTAQQAIIDHIQNVSSVRRKAERVAKSGRRLNQAERRGQVAVGLGEETVRASAKELTRLEKRRAFLQGELDQYNQTISLAEQSTHPLGDIAANRRRVAKLTEQLKDVDRRIAEGSTGPVNFPAETPNPEADVVEMTRKGGGILPEFMAPGGLSKNYLLSTLKEEVRSVLGDDLGEKMMQGVTTLGDLRKRLEQVQLNPSVLAGEAWREVRDAMRAHGIQRPGYFPMVDANRVGYMDWLKASTSKGMEAAIDPHEKWNSGELLRRGTYLKDPLQARLIRAARHTKADAAVRTIEAVVSSKLGRVIKEGDHLAPDEVGIAIEHVRGINRISKYFYDARLKNLMEGMDDADATLAAIDDTTRNIQDRIAAGELEEGGVQMYAISKKVGDKLNATARGAGVINGPYAKIYVQGPMNVWRSMVLAGSPRWLVNNILGNTVFSVMQGAPVARMFHILEGRYAQILEDKKGWKLNWVPGAKSGKTLVGAINGVFDQMEYDGTTVGEAVGSGGNVLESDLAHTPQVIPGAANVAGPGPKIMAKTRSLRAVPKSEVKSLSRGARVYRRTQKVGDFMRAANGEIETAARMNSALTALERTQGITRMKKLTGQFGRQYERLNTMARDGVPGEAVARSIVKEMNHFLGDFTSLSPWERNVMRPYIFPFWGFYKHTAKLLLSYPFEYPERAVVLGALANATQDMMDAYGPMPEWMAGAMPLAPPGVGPQPFLATSGPNPFSGLFQSPVSSLSPLIKIPLEHFTGRNLFTGQPFSDKDHITPFGTEQSFKIIRDKNGMPIGTEPVNKVTPSLWEHMLSQIPQYELLKDAIAGGKTYDTSGIIDSFTGKGLIKDATTGEAKYPTGTLQAVAKFAGFSQMPFDYSAYQTWLAEQQDAALTEALNREGYGAA